MGEFFTYYKKRGRNNFTILQTRIIIGNVHNIILYVYYDDQKSSKCAFL